jgi:hypothetical protein
MKIWKIAALVALAAIPVLLMTKKERKGDHPVVGDPDNIFESELTVD